jgi:L-alanine-DL-glutamate epimerase-like enolase superfamily enzyme
LTEHLGTGATTALGRIASIEARSVAVPLPKPARLSRRLLDVRHYTLVRVSDEEGTTGIGFCLGGPPVADFVRFLAPHALGRDVAETEKLWDELYYETILIGRRGGGLRALSIIDIALWDLKAKLLGVPLAQLLGVHSDPVPAYASGGYFVEGEGLAELDAEVTRWAQDGYAAIKVKVGGVPLEEDVERLRTIRRAVGGHIRLMLDANNAWRDVPSALRAIRRFEEFDLEWIEEPLSPDDVDGHRRLAEMLDTSVATGEIEATRWGFAPIFRERAADVIQVDAAVCGGVSEWLKIAHTACTFDVPVAPHWFSDLHVHLVAAIPNGIWIEHFTNTRILNVMELFERSLEVAGGYASLPREPGLGIELKEAVVERHALGDWA